MTVSASSLIVSKRRTDPDIGGRYVVLDVLGGRCSGIDWDTLVDLWGSGSAR